MHQTKKKNVLYQQGLQGAEFRSLGHVECIRLKKKFLAYQQGLSGAKFRSLGHMECIRVKKNIPGIPAGVAGCKIQVPGTYGMHQTKKKNSRYTSRGCRVQNLGL